jgi:hypothetical protein
MQQSATTVTDDYNNDLMTMMEEEEGRHMVPYIKPFSKPLFQTFGMFVGMVGA